MIALLNIAGSIGLGLVWGWLAVRRSYKARWPVVARVLLWVIVQALVVGFAATLGAVGWFVASVALAALLCRAWLRALALRYDRI